MNTKLTLYAPANIAAAYPGVKGVRQGGNTFATFHKIVDFDNGLSLSVVSGPFLYGDEDAPFEIAAKNADGEIDGSLLMPEDQYEDVLGYCTMERVMEYVAYLAAK